MLKVISFNFDNNPDSHKLATSANKYGYNLSFVGNGHSFKDFRAAKIDLLLNEIKGVKEKYVMYTDGLDSWFLRGDILKEYKKFNSPIVISGNRDHYPSTNLYTKYPEAPTSVRYICSSQIIGTKESLVQALELMQNEYKGFTDQEGWNLLYVKKMVKMKIDHSCKLFLNMTNVLENEISNFVFNETKSRPCSIHFGGPKGGSPNAILMNKMYNRWSNG